MSYPKILLRPEKDYIGYFPHPWIFGKAFNTEKTSKTEIRDGEIVDTYSSDSKRFFARGCYNSHSQIALRILTRDYKETIDTSFFEKRFRNLLHLRERFIDTKNTNAFRVVFGESDGIPGLILDKYDQVFVIQIHTLGMELLRNYVITAIKSVFHPQTIFERSDVGVRLAEGLTDMPVRHIYGKKIKGEIEIREHGVRFFVNVEKGQKTGFFLDQRENRKALQRYVEKKRILNCFCYTGGFSVYAALAGATETVNVDVSGEALATAKRNFSLNDISLKNHAFIEEDAFEALEKFSKNRERFDIVILDPPAFVKNQKSLTKGLAGYLFINQKAISLLPPGGILISSSCSAHVTDEMFQKMLGAAAAKSSVTLKTLEIRHQPVDHPFNLHFPEGKYLKFYVMVKQV